MVFIFSWIHNSGHVGDNVQWHFSLYNTLTNTEPLFFDPLWASIVELLCLAPFEVESLISNFLKLTTVLGQSERLHFSGPFFSYVACCLGLRPLLPSSNNWRIISV